MKFIDSPMLETLNALLATSTAAAADMSKIFCRLELYSCKNTAPDKRLLKHLDDKYSTHFASVSPPSRVPALAPKISRKTLFYLRATLNAALPDYDFSDIRDEAFRHCKSLADVMNSVNAALFTLDPHAGETIWSTLAEVMEAELEDCDLYAFTPTSEEFDEGDGTVWAFYYFFFNKKLKRIILFSSRAVSFMAPADTSREEAADLYSLPGSSRRSSLENGGMSYEQYTMMDMEMTEKIRGKQKLMPPNPKPAVTFRRYRTESDLHSSIHLIEADLSEPYSIYTYRYFLHGWPSLCFLAHAPPEDGDGGEGPCIGIIISKCDESKRGVMRGYIAMLAVDPAWRSQGIASRLVKMACTAVREDYAGVGVVLETEVSNEKSLGFYASLGFIRDKRLKSYYLNGSDAFRLKLLL